MPGAAPKVMTSASESYSLPKSLSVPVMRAIRPSMLSRKAARNTISAPLRKLPSRPQTMA